MKVNMKGLINRLDSLRERMNYLFEKLEELDDEQEDIEIEDVERFFQDDDAFNLSIAIDILEQTDKLDKVLDIFVEKNVDIGLLKGLINGNPKTALEDYNDTSGEEDLIKEEYDLLKEVLL